MKLFLVIVSLFFLCFQEPQKQQQAFQPIIEHSKIEPQYLMLSECDSVRMQLIIAKYKLERVKYYLKICKRNPKQTKFLVSWISRAVE